MKKNKYIIFTLIISLLCINKSYATCTDAMKDEYEKIKDQYKITSTFDSNSKTYTVRIHRADTNKFIYTTALTAQYKCKNINNTTIECSGVEPGKSFYAYILGKTKDCDIMLNNETIKLENVNKFYDDPLCEGIEEFVLCQEIYDRDIDRETFEKRIKQYKKNKQIAIENNNEEQLEIEKEDNEKENNIVENTTSYMTENTVSIIIISIIIILLIIGIIFKIYTSKKRRRLE